MAILVLLTTVLAAPVLADRKRPTPPMMGTNVAEGMPAAPAINFQGDSVYNWVPEEGWQGFGFGLNPAIVRPLIYPFIQSFNGTPTLDKRRARVFAEWGFICFDPRLTGAGIGYGSWNREGGIRFTNEKFIVQVTVTFYEYGVEPLDPSDPSAGFELVRGDLIAGPFVGTGKANATTNWEAFLNSFGWARGLNFGVGQQETSDCRLQLEALTKSFKGLKPVAPILLPSPF